MRKIPWIRFLPRKPSRPAALGEPPPWGLGVAGVRVQGDVVYRTRAMVLCAGTFMQGLLHLGETTLPGGRMGEPTTSGISRALLMDAGHVVPVTT